MKFCVKRLPKCLIKEEIISNHINLNTCGHFFHEECLTGKACPYCSFICKSKKLRIEYKTFTKDSLLPSDHLEFPAWIELIENKFKSPNFDYELDNLPIIDTLMQTVNWISNFAHKILVKYLLYLKL